MPKAARALQTAFHCELEVVFLQAGVEMMEELWQYHNLAQNGCSRSYDHWREVPAGSVALVAPRARTEIGRARWSKCDANPAAAAGSGWHRESSASRVD